MNIGLCCMQKMKKLQSFDQQGDKTAQHGEKDPRQKTKNPVKFLIDSIKTEVHVFSKINISAFCGLKAFIHGCL